MSLNPSPLSSRPTPLLNPTDPVPGRGSALIGGIVAVALAVVVVVVSSRVGNKLLFFAQGITNHAQVIANQLPQIQGFNYYWTGGYDPAGAKDVGYNNLTANQHNIPEEANAYHMNLMVIAVTADQDQLTGTQLVYTPGATVGNPQDGLHDIDSYPEATYLKLVEAAKASGMTPVLRLEVRVLGQSNNDPSATPVGLTWQGGDAGSVASERAWFNSYTQFAVHFAQLSAKWGLPMLIIGHDLSSIAYDAPDTSTGFTHTARTGEGGDPGALCYGRRDCEWRHVIAAIHNTNFPPLGGGKRLVGGSFGGVLTFAATTPSSATQLGPTPEWQAITWWDALDVIGIEAFFPLTTTADPSVQTLVDAWQGNILPSEAVASPIPRYIDQLRAIANQYSRHILFTGAGYESLSGANSSPGSVVQPTDPANTPSDDQEQANAMEALLRIFTNQPWWLGAIWSSDYPQWKRSLLAYTTYNGSGVGLSEPFWGFNTEWAGDCIPPASCTHPEKAGGQVLRQFYHPAPLPDTLWTNLKLAPV